MPFLASEGTINVCDMYTHMKAKHAYTENEKKPLEIEKAN